MQKYLFLILSLISLNLTGQTSRFHIDVVANQHFNLEEGSPNTSFPQDAILLLEVYDYRSLGLHFFYEVNDYSDMGVGVEYLAVETRNWSDCNCPLPNPASGGPSPGVLQREHFFQFPLLFRLYPLKKDRLLTPFAGAALMPSLNRKSPVSTNRSRLQVNYRFSTGLQLQLFDWLKWAVEGHLAYQHFDIEGISSDHRYLGVGSRLSFPIH
ncbi:MAG: hypothetical protein AAGG75_11005 [Bacteroidota bacterium]